MTRMSCPDVSDWQALLGETGTEGEPDDLVRHLEACADCQGTLQALAAESTVWEDAARGLGDGARGEAALRRVVERLKTEDFPPPGDEDLSFLRPADRPGLLGLLGRYEVQEVIGHGGMGVVFRALDPDLNRVVAIKVVSPWLASSATARRRFVREAQAAAAVCHDHVVTVHGVNEADGLPYLVMQYVAGESLQARLDRIGPLEVTEVVRIGMQTAAGLAAAHAQGLIHRDIKPANLLLENGLARVKISDFGLARMADDVQLTRDGVVAGTPEYMAPEQARGEPIDHRADLFSLGSVLYATCTGVPPFRGASVVAVLRRVSDEEPKPVRSLNPDVPAWMESLIARLMAKDPVERFQSAGEVTALLEGYLAHVRQPATVPVPELPATGNSPRPAEARPLPGSVGRSRSRLWLAALVVVAAFGLAVAQWFAGAGDVTEPIKEYKDQYLISLRGTPENSEGFEFFGPDVAECVRYEPAGLRLTFPRGFPGPRPGTGLTIPVAAKGDFEITLGFEILQEPEPADAGTQQTLFSLDVVLDAPGDTVATIGRKVDGRGGTQFLAWMTVWDEAAHKDRGRGKGFPTTAKSGRLRMVRAGSTLSYCASDGPDGEFVLLDKFPFAAEDLKFVRLLGSTGGPQASLDVRATDLRIRAGSLPELPEKSGGKGWLAAGTILGLLILVLAAISLGAWLYGRQRRRMGQAPAAGAGEQAQPTAAEHETASAAISFACSACGKMLKAKAELSGKKVKCPQCGQAVFVPAAKAGKAGRASS
ncbi:MAG TPA: protein kinase [Gemmataceae bacterium]|nr:protein kinase [Gemmataceae bacterium]